MESGNVERLPVKHAAVQETVDKARQEAQDKVRKEVRDFMSGWDAAGSEVPVDVVIVFRLPNGGIGYSAPEGDGVAQVGMLALAANVLERKLTGGA